MIMKGISVIQLMIRMIIMIMVIAEQIMVAIQMVAVMITTKAIQITVAVEHCYARFKWINISHIDWQAIYYLATGIFKTGGFVLGWDVFDLLAAASPILWVAVASSGVLFTRFLGLSGSSLTVPTFDVSWLLRGAPCVWSFRAAFFGLRGSCLIWRSRLTDTFDWELSANGLNPLTLETCFGNLKDSSKWAILTSGVPGTLSIPR